MKLTRRKLDILRDFELPKVHIGKVGPRKVDLSKLKVRKVDLSKCRFEPRKLDLRKLTRHA